MLCDHALRLKYTRICLNFDAVPWNGSAQPVLNASAVNGVGTRAGGAMTVKEYVLKRLNQGETDLNVLARQTRIQFPSLGISFSNQEDPERMAKGFGVTGESGRLIRQT